jgi:3',5'-cyclic AMP phosphodiesterase CpdA
LNVWRRCQTGVILAIYRSIAVRIVQLSDTHISHLGGIPTENMTLLTSYINQEIRPELVVHTGDVVIANPDSAQDRDAARRLLAQIDAPLLVLPGNHDVGESADNPWMGIPVTSGRIAGYTSTWGEDRFFLDGEATVRSGNWVFIGLNSERFGSGLPQEDEQWDWLAGAAARARGKSVLLFLHKPLWFPGGSAPGITVSAADRQRLIALFAEARLRVVANGHVHRYRRASEGEILTVWAPSTTFATPANPKRGLGPSSPGIVEYLIDGDDVQAELRLVPGLRGVHDATTMPEFTAVMAEIEAR